MDLVLASVGLVMLSPILLLIALTIELDSRGPVLYRQARHGLDGEVFSLIKFPRSGSRRAMLARASFRK